MKKLKTLKDINNNPSCIGLDVYDNSRACFYLLRDIEEVVKVLIKEMVQQRSKIPDHEREGYHFMTGKIWAFREFFNLEDE